jgi:hypothetical protein
MTVAAVATGFGGAGVQPSVAPRAAMVAPSAGTGQPLDQPSAQPAPPAREIAREARVGGPAEAALRAAPPEVAAAPHRGGDSIGRSVLDGVNRLQEGDRAWRTGAGAQPTTAHEPTLKVAAREPGPAAAQIKGDPAHGAQIAGHPTTQPGRSANPSFDGMIHQLEQVSGQVIQVSLVSKTTSSFTGALNKLLSSG